jgi:hypothetical protein
VNTDTTTPETTQFVSAGSSEGLFCTLCKAQGCSCWRDRCVNCGLKAP